MSNILTTFLSVTACKITRAFLRVAHSGGTTLPGSAAMIFDRDILRVVSHNMDIIVVTGTNGKTTTSNMIEQALSSSGLDVLANKSGANLLKGITAEFCANATALGRPKKRYAVIECDEGALKQVVPLIKPKAILVTNLFRDQLDRYGEVTNTLEEIKRGVIKVPESVLCLNADCSLTSSLGDNVPNKIMYYGCDCAFGDQKEPVISDAKYCVICGSEYQYNYRTYAHLGSFYCPKCGYKRHRTDTAVVSVDKLTADGTDVTIACRTYDDKKGAKDEIISKVTVALPAIYNVYNAIGAMCAYTTCGYNTEDLIKSLAVGKSSFGRMERFDLDGVKVQMILVKNPAGCNQALSYLTNIREDFRVIICLNDKTADGHDISWIWDAEYEMLVENPCVKVVYVCGDRATDAGLRLKYAGLRQDKIKVINGWDEVVSRMREDSLPVFVLPNYTSMLALRSVLADATGKDEFWKG